MIIVKTPYRISFFGGGTDYEAWYSKFGGKVLTCTIDKYCYVCLRYMPAFLGSKYIVFWSKMEKVNHVKDIQHNGVRGCLEYLGIDDGIEVNHAGDLPARSGLGSSSSFTVGMLHALHLLKGNKPDKALLAQQAIKVEQEVLKETVGIQDQIQCAWGGINHIKFDTDGEYSIRHLSLEEGIKQKTQDHLIMFFTGLQRTASDIATEQVSNVNRKQAELHAIADLVDPATTALKKGDMKEFGRLLHESWMLKRTLSDKITTPELDDIYGKARSVGAYGGKLLGAGGGGFFLFCIDPGKRQELINKLGLLHVPVRFEFGGSQIVEI